MRVEFYIACRLSSRKEGARAGIMERVATIATAVSLMVIIITLGVVFGFKRELNSFLSSAIADVVVTAPQSQGLVSAVGLERTPSLEAILDDEDVVRCTPYRAKEGVILSNDNITGVVLKGIDSLYDLRFFEEHLMEGTLPRLSGEPRSKDILISDAVARKMDVEAGERVEMVFVDERGGVIRDRFAISGLFATGVDFIDEGYVLTDMRNVARIYDGNHSIATGYELWLTEDADANIVAERLNAELIELFFEEGIDAEAFSLERLFPVIFGWLATHDVNAMLVIVIMIIVALLNIATALLIIVLERQRMIGELRALGFRRGDVVRVFFFRALFIVLRGVAWGTMLGIAICIVQYQWHLIPLPAEGYFLSFVPISLCWGEWLLAIVGTIAVIMLIMILPALYTARISPAETMKYE